MAAEHVKLTVTLEVESDLDADELVRRLTNAGQVAIHRLEAPKDWKDWHVVDDAVLVTD